MDVDWIGALIGAVAGAVLTAAGGYGAYLIERSRVERETLRDLARSLSERRAFRIAEPRTIPGAKSSDDFDRLARSVIDARRDIGLARSKLVHKRAAQVTLTTMVQLCNEYLEASEAQPTQYWFLAAELRDQLHRHLQTLRIDLAPVPVPGSGAFLPTR